MRKSSPADLTEPAERAIPAHDRPGVVFVVTTIAAMVIAIASSDDGWVPILDSANLAFHEAGHLIFGILGETLGLYGGTLGQLVFPVVAIVTFRQRKQVLGLSLAWLWLLENGLNIARYMADARAQQLPLVGGGEHDWEIILSNWGMLAQDTSIAGLLQFTASCGVLALWLVAGWRWLQSR